ncbi:dynein regulatory complex subunit 7 [Embiotoca jacksoni]|uniref:dynein regulatory complex subunit 7 n=1 Tax=Embiotoca jacksoni TaxID=100190 RepID=UPI003703EA54
METVLDREEEEKENITDLTKLEKNVSQLHVSGPQEELPLSYRTNCPDEERLLDIADSFQRRYLHLYPERKPLLLCTANECGVQKFVSTSIRPTLTGHPELFTWQGCAAFVADFLSLEPLEPPVDLPRYLRSSSWVLQTQRASCFEASSLLCSLLLGVGYDSYCVCGYAVKELCLLDRSLEDCPLVDRSLEDRPLLDIQGKQSERQRPADPLRGLRVYCWVLVLSGSRSIEENFFLDPLSGNIFPTDSQLFLGIESVWNNLNCYVNLQDCSSCCTDVAFDVQDILRWEPVLHGSTSRRQLIQEVLQRKMMGREQADEEEAAPQMFQMPQSWLSDITISETHLQNRWPGGTKVVNYRQVKLERFTGRTDGLITRRTTYRDLDCTEVAMVTEWYQHRVDHLEQRHFNMVDNVTSERFTPGRRFHLLFHRWTGTERQVGFSSARLDHLAKRHLSADEMTETFEGRNDFLSSRHVFFSQNADEQSHAHTKLQQLPVQKVVERFHRNHLIAASDDVAQRVFLPPQRLIQVMSHLEEHHLVPSTHIFSKPHNSTELQREELFTPQMVHSFQVQPGQQPLPTHTLYKLLVSLMEDEEEVIRQIGQSMKEMKDIVVCREQEKEAELETAGDHSLRQETEYLIAEEEEWLQVKDEDVLAPLLIRLGCTDPLSPEEARRLHQNCLSEFRERLVLEANLIQERCEQEALELQVKQQWYQENQIQLTQQQQQEYQKFCSEKTLRVHVAQKTQQMDTGHRVLGHRVFGRPSVHRCSAAPQAAFSSLRLSVFTRSLFG